MMTRTMKNNYEGNTMMFFKKFREFFKSEAYDKDAYGYLTNQIGHLVLGNYLMTIVVSIAYFFYYDGSYYPSQIPFAIALMFGYVAIWELGIQGWKGLDTIEDSMYFCLGTALWLFVEMDEVIDRLLVWCLVFTVLLGFGVYRRIK